MTAYIRSFQEIGKEDIVTAGGKGANLGEMVGAGIPVPEGMVLTTDAYREFAGYNRIDVTQEPEQIRQQFRQGVIPEEVQRQINEAYQSMGDQVRVAVRSSATAEDLADASFAGQQETFLNVRGEEELSDAIKRCYASLWGDRAVSYRREKGYASEETALAVVIQKMVESDAAGVLFTVNPADGNRDRILINASYGLGESVVSGAVSPDELICGRNGKVISSVTGSKQTKVIYGERGTVTVPVEEAERNRISITEGQIELLVKEALKIEEHYGAPMDIEWAFVGNQLYILQARAVTATFQKDERIKEEAMPPLMPVNGKMKESLMFMLEKEPFAYYPLDYDFCIVLGGQKSVIFREAGLKIDNDCRMDENGFMLLPSVKIRLGGEIVHLPALLHEMGEHAENVRRTEECLKKAEPEIYGAAGQNMELLGLEECASKLEKLYQLIKETAYARFKYAVFPGFMMNRTLGKYLKKTDPALSAYNLLTGLSYKTAEMNRALRKLADQIAQTPEARKILFDGGSYESLSASDPSVRQGLEKFLEQFGYKSDFPDYCFAAKTWLEDKERFLQVLRPQVAAADDAQGDMTMEEGLDRYQKLVADMTEGLSEKKKKKIQETAEYYRIYHIQRERTQYLWEACFYACRKTLGRIAQLLGTTPEKLLYLRYPELQKVLQSGKLQVDDLERIKRREALRPTAEEYWKRQQWEVCKGDGETLRGISGSAGRAEGKVCVVLSPSDFAKLQKGDILVCRYTDPEWTPLFALAAAVVSDTGGVLSHAAIVAREYKIPAVLAVGNATTVLQDGDKVLVDGMKGEIERL